MRADFLYVSNLQYEVKSLKKRVSDFESGQAYHTMKTSLTQQLRKQERMVRSLAQELSDSRRDAIRMRNDWMMVNEDVIKECDKRVKVWVKRFQEMEKRALKAENTCDHEREKNREMRRELYQVQTLLEEEKGKNQQLISQLNRDYENSGIPSTGKETFKKIRNSRENTGRSPGGQPGHKGHCRKKLEPTKAPVYIDAPEEITSNVDFYPTGKEIRKQIIDVKLLVTVTEYVAREYRNRKNGTRYHARFLLVSPMM